MKTNSRTLAVCLLCLVSVSAECFLASAQTPDSQGQKIAPPTATKQWTGDLDVLLKKRAIRIGVPYSKTFYYTVKGVQYGTAYETGKELERYLNKKYPQVNKNIKILVVLFAVPRDKAASMLQGGSVDILAGGIAVTERRKMVADFCDPIYSGVSEIVVTAPDGPQIASAEDLSGKTVSVRKTSSYWEHLEALNERFKQESKPEVKLQAVPEDLSDEDLLEMVNSGLLPATVVSDWTAKLWSKLLPKMVVHTDAAISTGGTLAWAVRKDSPKLLADLNDFFKTHRQGTAFSRELISRYVNSTYMLKQAVSETGMKQFQATSAQFKKHASEYGTDYLLMMAKGFQESSLNQNAKSPVGAIGIMQLMPATGKEMKVGDITQQDNNINAGIKYFRQTEERYFGNEPMDELNKVLFTMAAYNCGPNRVKQLRQEASAKGLDPNVWINNVEVIAAARVGMETVSYVSNIYKYYIAYKLVTEQEEQRQKARDSLATNP
jgi:membrane-bound lytic murein transglycosylase MltF